MHMLHIIKIICIILLFSSSFIITVPQAIELSDSSTQQITSVTMDSGVQVTHSVIALKFVFLTVFLYFLVKANTFISSIMKIKHFFRPTVYIFKMRGLLNPVKFQSRFMV